jgi:putative ABC transport system permease protein
MIGIAVGIAAVILLTSIGEGTRRYILAQFSQFGTNLIAIHPGKTKTSGMPGMFGGTTHHLTSDDAAALARIPGVQEVVPTAFGTARVEAGERGRNVAVNGVTPDVRTAWKFEPRVGGFWPGGDARRGAPLTVLGPKLARELFDDRSPLGAFVRIGGVRFRVVGVMEPKGQMLGFDLDDTAYVPVATAMRLFNLADLGEIDLTYEPADAGKRIEADVKRILTARHGGEEDFTVTSQEAMLEVFGNVMNVVTMAVGAIAGISLVVGAIGILTMMWISVNERVNEIGLAKALGETRRQIVLLFLGEAALLSFAGGVLGVTAGMGIAFVLARVVEDVDLVAVPETLGAATDHVHRVRDAPVRAKRRRIDVGHDHGLALSNDEEAAQVERSRHGAAVVERPTGHVHRGGADVGQLDELRLAEIAELIGELGDPDGRCGSRHEGCSDRRRGGQDTNGGSSERDRGASGDPPPQDVGGHPAVATNHN